MVDGRLAGADADAPFAAAVEEVAFAYECVPFFGGHLRSAGIEPGEIRSRADFRRIPPTTKAHYRRNFPVGVLAVSASLQDPHLLRSHSSGTGGDRLITVSSTYDLAERMSMTISAHRPIRQRLLGLRGQRICRYAAPNCSDVECASPRSTMQDRILRDGTLVLPVGHDLLATPEEMLRLAADEIELYQPDWLYTDPTHLAFLIRYLRAREVPAPDTDVLLLTYTQATQVSRRQIAEFFPPSVESTEVLSMSEFGWIVAECPSRNAHLNVASFFMELLVDGRPAEPGELAELYVTSLGDRVIPHIRYKTGDLYSASPDPCRCGHPFPVVRHEGRNTHLLLVDDAVTVTPKALDDAIDMDWIDVYRMHQGAESHFRFDFCPNERSPVDAEQTLRLRLQQLLGAPVTIDVRSATYIPGERSGKFLSCTSAVAEEKATGLKVA